MPQIQNLHEPAAEEKPLAKISKKQIRAHIDILAGEGHSAEEIASMLGISIAEVNLAFNLHSLKKIPGVD